MGAYFKKPDSYAFNIFFPMTFSLYLKCLLTCLFLCIIDLKMFESRNVISILPPGKIIFVANINKKELKLPNNFLSWFSSGFEFDYPGHVSKKFSNL